MSQFSTDNPKQLAEELFGQGKYPEAEVAYIDYLRGHPHDALGWRTLGMIQHALKKVDESLESVEKAVQQLPSNPEIRYAKGYLLGSAERDLEAISELDATLELMPNHIAAKQALFYCLMRLGKKLALTEVRDALPLYSRAHKVDQKSPIPVVALLEGYYQTGQRGKILDLYRSLTDEQKSNDQIKATIENMQKDPDYSALIANLHVKPNYVQYPTQSTPNTSNPANQIISCPFCKMQVMSFAAVCPHCRQALKTTKTFTGQQHKIAVPWQETAFSVMTILRALLAVIEIVILAVTQSSDVTDYASSTLALVFAVCLYLRVESVMSIARILLWISIALTSLAIVFSLFTIGTSWGILLLAVLLFSLFYNGFMLYLLNYVDGY